jgi:hypothetical protein
LNLTRSVDSREYPTHVIGEVPGSILENGVSVAPERKRALCVAWDGEIRMIQKIERIGP